MEKAYTYNDFQKAWMCKERRERIYNAWDGKGAYAKMANQTRMSKKRLKKLLMAEGLSRNGAEETVEKVSKMIKNGRLVWWNRQLPYVAQRIDYRQAPAERFLDSIGCYLTKREREALRGLRKYNNSKNSKADFDEFNRLREKFPDCTTATETKTAWQRSIVEHGFTDDVREMWKLQSWLHYLEECEK